MADFGYKILGFGGGSRVITPFVSATGGTETTCGNYKIHAFTGSGTLQVLNEGTPAGSTSFEYFVVGGGGLPGSFYTGGGGGGGGFRNNIGSPAFGGLTAVFGAQPVTVGAIGGVPGAIAGGLIGFVLADGERITPCDMIAIPAYQYSAMLTGREPTFQIFIKEGELIAPVLPTDTMLATAVVNEVQGATMAPKRKLSAWQRYLKQKKNQIKFKSGKKKGQLNLKAMGKAYRRSRK